MRKKRDYPIAGHGRGRVKPGARLLRMLGVSLAVVLVSALGVGGFVAFTLANDFAEGAVALPGTENMPPDIGAYPDGFNLLLVGIDECEQKYAKYMGDRCPVDENGILIDDGEGTLNDVNMLVHVSDDPRRVTAVSLPRDLQVEIPGCTAEDGTVREWVGRNSLNAAFGYGGLPCVAATVEELTGQTIDFGAFITFGGVIEITNAIGGSARVCRFDN